MSGDARGIKSISREPGTYLYEVGSYGVTRIEAYEETGSEAYVTWFRIWKGNVLHSRVNSLQILEVKY